MDAAGTVVDIRRFAVHDGPGIRTTVFLKGCPLACAWCHNPEGQAPAPRLWWFAERCLGCGACVAACPERALRLEDGRIAIAHAACRAHGACTAACPAEAIAFDARRMSVAEVLAEVRADRTFHAASGGGLTLSGGDPLAQPAFAAALLAAARAEGIGTAVETCLHAPWTTVEALLPHTGRWLVDLKLADAAAHRRWTGQGQELIHANLRRLHAAGAAITVRVPLIPGATDDDANLAGIAALARELAPGAPIEALDFNPLAEAKYRRLGRDWSFAGRRPLGHERLAAIHRLLTGSPACA